LRGFSAHRRPLSEQITTIQVWHGDSLAQCNACE
jgi:hypothetical protein